jgi:hypothetical protein
MNRSLARASGAVLAIGLGLALGACDKKSADTTPLPNVAATVPVTAPASTAIPPGIVPADSASATAGSGASAAATATATPTGGAGNTGAESSGSKATGPGNGSTAIGGVVGGQAAGGTGGAKPAPTAGDGTAPSNAPTPK